MNIGHRGAYTGGRGGIQIQGKDLEREEWQRGMLKARYTYIELKGCRMLG
jgi:hypothetical protein